MGKGFISQIYPLKCSIMNYEWGSKRFLAELCGRHSPSDLPEAELWIGAHPRAPSHILYEGKWRPLNEIIREFPFEILGNRVVDRFGKNLPFLFKIIAPEKALSIQVHPDKIRAERGFRLEEERGIPRDAPFRNYRDPNHKPEMLCPLMDFELLLGFRAPDEIVELLRWAGLDKVIDMPLSYKRGDEENFLKRIFLTFMHIRWSEDVGNVLKDIESEKKNIPEARWILKLHEQFGDDPGIFAPLFMNLLRLSPFEVICLRPGELHAYLSGAGIEVMADSDNVLRAALTSKHRDLKELIEILKFEIYHPNPAKKIREDIWETVFESPFEEFLLSYIRLSKGVEYKITGRETVEIILFIKGGGEIEGEDGKVIKVSSCDTFMVPSSVPEYTIRGGVELFRVRPLIS